MSYTLGWVSYAGHHRACGRDVEGGRTVPRSLADLFHVRKHAHGSHDRAVELMQMEGAPFEDIESVRHQGQHRTVIGNVAMTNLPVSNRVTVTQLGVVTGI